MEFLKWTENEKAETAKEMLCKDIVFMTSCDTIYFEGEKHSYSELGERSFALSDEKVMVDIAVFAKVTGIEYFVSEDGVTIGEKTYSACKKDGKVYIYAAELAKDMGKYVYEDNRNFVLISDVDRGYVNSVDSFISKEPIDVIWRYLHFDRLTYDELYDALKGSKKYKKHPRLFVTEEKITKLRERANTDSYASERLSMTTEAADKLLTDPPFERKLIGFRLFGACEAVKNRLITLSTAYIFTGDKRYADRAWLEIENSLNWQDLNFEVHSLDSGEFGPGIAVAYDVFYDYFTDEQKAFIRRRMEKMYFDYCVGIYHGDYNFNAYDAMGYKNTQCNWGAVCGTSMLMCAITFMDEEAPDSEFTAKCKYIAVNAMQTLEHMATIICPDGKWDEGMGYWEYVATHFGWTLVSLNNTFGTTFGFLEVPGMLDLPKQALYLQTRNGLFEYADATWKVRYIFTPEALIYSELSGDRGCSRIFDDFYKQLNLKYGYYRYLLFAPEVDTSKSADTSFALDKYYKTNGICTMRADFDDPNSAYVGIVGGITGTYNNCHFDKGSFIFEALGERWLIDMGRNDNATFPYLKRTETHNAVTINPSAEYNGQEMEIPAYAERFESKPEGALVIYDLSDVYLRDVKEYHRGFRFLDNRTALEVRDEFTLKEKSIVNYNLITRAETVEIDKDGCGVTLYQNGKECKITFISNIPDLKIELGDLTPVGGFNNEDEEKFACGITPARLGGECKDYIVYAKPAKRIRLTAEADGDIMIAARITPMTEGVENKVQSNTPLGEWQI